MWSKISFPNFVNVKTYDRHSLSESNKNKFGRKANFMHHNRYALILVNVS